MMFNSNIIAYSEMQTEPCTQFHLSEFVVWDDKYSENVLNTLFNNNRISRGTNKGCLVVLEAIE